MKELVRNKNEQERTKEELKENTETIAKQRRAIEELKEQSSIEAGKMKKELKSLKNFDFASGARKIVYDYERSELRTYTRELKKPN